MQYKTSLWNALAVGLERAGNSGGTHRRNSPEPIR